MQLDASQCGRSYQDLGTSTVNSVTQKLKQYAAASAKRCKEKYLDEASHALGEAEQALGNLTDEEFCPLLCCILTCQMNSCNSSSLFLRLEKILLKISEKRLCLVSQQRELMLKPLLEGGEVLQLKDVQAVCMYLEGSPAGRMYFAQHLADLLSKVSLVFSTVIQGHVSPSTEQCHMLVKLCLQLFRELPKDIGPLVWDSDCVSDPMKSILESLLHIIRDQSISRDARLLAGTAVAALANTGPVVKKAAQATVNLVQQFTNGSGGVQFGTLHVSLYGPSVDEVGLLALIRGLLTCGHADLLTCVLDSSTKSITLLELLLPSIASLCERQTEQYYCFQVFCLWLQRVRDQIPTLLNVRGKFLYTDGKETMSVVTKLLWTAAEMQVDGMSSLSLSCFQHLLHINRAECEVLGLSEEAILRDIMQKVTEISWQARSRYTPLCALIPFLGSEKTLALYSALPAHLFCCLSINFLCPPAAETYRILVTLQKDEWLQKGIVDQVELGKKWAQIWLSHFTSALSSIDCSLQNNTATHLLPCTLHTFSESSNLLAKELDGSGPRQLRAWISLAHAQKAILGQLAGVEGKLPLCLESADDGVRLSAFSFLCFGPRSNQPPSLQELQLLKKYLPYSMGCDSPGFRQQLQAALRRALERLRDGAMSSLRRGQSKTGNVTWAVDFTEWLFQLSVSLLSPAGNYQRRCSGLLSLCTLLECCTDCWSPYKKKGQPPQDMSLLVRLAQQRGCWDFKSAHSMEALLGCMQDSTNEIREMAADLLSRFFLPAPRTLVIALFQLGKNYLCSPRVPLAEAGALIMKTLLQRPDAVLLLTDDVPLTALGLVTFLTKMLEDHYCSAQENLLKAASTKPMQGVLSALRLCLLEVPCVSDSLSQAHLATSWWSLLQKLVNLLQEITSFILGMLHKSWGNEPADIAAPSFEDMGNAVRAHIAHSKGLEEVQSDIFLSEEHSLIMTCCWVSLKEIGMFLGPLVEKLMSSSLIAASAVKDSVATYHDIFMRCRHWGAVDGCSTGFTKLCSYLLHHKDSKLRDIPKEMMEQVLVVVKSQNSLSVTRRAAGIPVFLQCILSAEGPQHPLLEACITSLLALAKKPFPTSWDQTRDLPQVTAVHALQSMLRSASLRSSLLSRAIPLMSLALASLSSPCWAMRNAALQLFTALTVGMLELSRSDVDNAVQSTLHVGALLRRFPCLQDILLQELPAASEGKNMLHPSLYPILTLLAKLQPGGDADARCFIEPLLELRGNPIYAVRVLAARALVPVMQEMDYHHLLVQLTLELPQRDERVPHNVLHGQLQQIYALLSSALKGNCISDSAQSEVTQHLLSRLWLLSSAQQCPLVRKAFLDLLFLLTAFCEEDSARQVQDAVCKELSAKEPFLLVGADAFREACVHYLCNEAARLLDNKASSYVCQLLQDKTTAVLKWLNEQQDLPTELGQAVRHTLQDTLHKVLREESPQNLSLHLESYVHLHRVCPSLSDHHLPQDKNMECMSVLLSLLQANKGGPQLQCHALSALSLLLAQRQHVDDVSHFARWLSVLSVCADPAVSCDTLRLAAANALQLAGAHLVQQALQCGTSELKCLAVRTIIYAVDLLQDEDRDVRELSARFAVAALNQPHDRTFHSEWAILRLLELLRDSFWSCEETFHALIERLPACDVCAVHSSLHDRPDALYEEDEPNMFADLNFFSCLLHPVLDDLMIRMCHADSLRSALLQWVQSTVTLVREQLKEYHSWAKQQGSMSVSWLAACGCSRVNSAVLGLLIRAELLLRAHEVLTGSVLDLSSIEPSIASVRKELSELKKEVSLYSLEHYNIKVKVGLFWKHDPHFTHSS
ncbi:tRNA (32-2'-O)-methyltransferase regulator THADA-like isoform X2 [Hyperolius riggenbachi]|uniref:tRNA (32-2'-O)-methyltransferase regulator THADA-like isoform X2 n=1 Tax=Hyperolius riggenbachi TaxID=752182 RepID=UPI0035A386BD